MLHRSIRLFLAIVALLFLVACGEDDDSGQSPPATIPRENIPDPVQHAIDAAASDAGVSASEIRLISFDEVEWNDTGLGCPEPDSIYAQVITPGFDVRLLIDGSQHTYHTDMNAAVVRCDA